MARWMREATLAHPAVARLRSAYNVWTPSIFPMTERWLGIWQQSGLELDEALLAASASSTAIIGFVEAELLYALTRFPDDGALSSFPNARLAFKLERERDERVRVGGAVRSGRGARGGGLRQFPRACHGPTRPAGRGERTVRPWAAPTVGQIRMHGDRPGRKDTPCVRHSRLSPCCCSP